VVDHESFQLISTSGNTIGISGNTLIIFVRGHIFNQSLALTYLSVKCWQALDEARRVCNRLEESLAQASLSDCKVWVQNASTGEFLPWQKGADIARTSWHQLLYNTATTRQL
jgi:hypothetical protein